MSELFIRRPSGDSEWTEDASALCNSFATAVRAALKDAEEYGEIIALVPGAHPVYF